MGKVGDRSIKEEDVLVLRSTDCRVDMGSKKV